MIYLEELNAPQQEAVKHQAGPLLIIAGAGAGKTRTVTYRIRHLIENGVRPSEILAITFTNKAAREMKERVEKLLWHDEASGEVGSKNMPFVSTFHSFSVYVLRAEHQSVGLPKFFSIFDRDDSLAKVKEALKTLGIEDKRFEPRKVLSAISRQKGDGVSLSEFKQKANTTSGGYNIFWPKAIASAWEIYENLLKKENALDFDDLLQKTVELLKKNPEILVKYQDRFRYIHIDEYQDTNTIQYELTRLLAEKYQNICVVGDMDQSIYGWRGADYTNLMRFEKDYPGTTTILLEENYRSTQTILTAANQIIEKNTKRFAKKLFTKNHDGAKIGLYAGLEEGDEARFIAQKAKEALEEGEKPEEIAILYRANFQSRVLEEAFLRSGVPYQVLGTRFYDRKEIKDIVSFIKLALNPQDFESMKRVINVPPRGIGKTTIGKIAGGQEDGLPAGMRLKLSQFRQILSDIAVFAETNKPSELIKYIIKHAGIEKMLKDGDEDDNERLENIKEFASVAVKYDHLDKDEGIAIMLSEIALSSEQDSLDDKKNGVKLMTVHASKGLEFNTVFVTGLEAGLFPHSGMGDSKKDGEEERRLFYVAITRARQKLYLSYAQSRMIFGSRQVNMPSEFIIDIDEDLIEAEDGLWTII